LIAFGMNYIQIVLRFLSGPSLVSSGKYRMVTCHKVTTDLGPFLFILGNQLHFVLWNPKVKDLWHEKQPLIPI
jgi:hypothetical protein